MKLYFLVVASIVFFAIDITIIQTCLSTKDNLTVLVGLSLAVVTPVAGYFTGKKIGAEYFALVKK